MLRRLLEPKQFTSEEFVTTVLESGAAFSMDGRGAWKDNVFIERFWRTIKYKEVYLRTCESVSDARGHLTRYMAFYNSRRPHSALDEKTLEAVYFEQALMVA